MLKTALHLLTSATLAATAAAGQSPPQRIVVPLADPSAPATLEVALLTGNLTVEAYEGAEILIEPSPLGPPERTRLKDGMFRIPNTSLGLTVEQEGNEVSIDGEWGSDVATLTVRVPRRTSVHASNINGGDITLRGVAGDHELSHVNGGINAFDVSGSVIASTTNGEVQVTFAAIDGDQPMSFSSFNGDVDVAFPADLGAVVRIKVAQGEILSDFEVALEPQPTTLTRDEDSSGTRFELESEVRGTIGRGGPELRFETYNGNVLIRKRGG